MLFLKWCGCLLLLFAAALGCHQNLKRLNRNLEIYDALLSLMARIKGQIDGFSTPVDEILNHTDLSSFPPAEPTLLGIAAACLPYLSGEGGRLIRAYAAEMGGTYRAEQLRRCDYYSGALEKERWKYQSRLKSRRRVCTALWLCGALAVCLILW